MLTSGQCHSASRHTKESTCRAHPQGHPPYGENDIITTRHLFNVIYSLWFFHTWPSLFSTIFGCRNSRFLWRFMYWPDDLLPWFRDWSFLWKPWSFVPQISFSMPTVYEYIFAARTIKIWACHNFENVEVPLLQLNPPFLPKTEGYS